jgi:AcrR family transcriptional regulator
MAVDPISPRERILAAAARLLVDEGRDAVTTRAVCREAGVQAQTIYRHFGDMRTLLTTVAADGFRAFLRTKKSREAGDDPIEELRAGWDLHIEFALDNPQIYALMYGEPRPGSDVLEVYEVLHGIVQRAAAAGRLTVPVDVAASVIYASGIGVAMTLITTSSDDLPAAAELSSTTRDAVIGAVTSGSSAPRSEGAARHAVALATLLAQDPHGLTDAEVALMHQWLATVSGRG